LIFHLFTKGFGFSSRVPGFPVGGLEGLGLGAGFGFDAFK
jgi:hypothetical protein